MKSRPSNWWTDSRVCVALSDVFRKHVLGLAIEYEFNAKREIVHYTGFMLCHRERDMWITAAHAIDEICELRRSKYHRIIRCRIVDHCTTADAEALPFDLEATQYYSATEAGLDFGAMWLPNLTVAGILGGSGVVPLTANIWTNRAEVVPEGYFLVGYPSESVQTLKTPIGGGLAKYQLTSTLVCLPVRMIEHGAHAAPSHRFWDDPEAFYGEILPFSGIHVEQPRDIVGMSGAPLFAFRQEPGGVRYYLWGIQRSWHEGHRFVRCEPVDRIIDAMRPQVGSEPD